MASLGTFSGGGLGMGLAFTLEDRFSGASRGIEASMRRLDTTTSQITTRINKGMAQISRGATMMAAGAVMAAPFVVGIKYAMDFESQISSVAATAQATAAEMLVLKNNALAMGEATAFTATEAAKAQEYLALAGFKVNDIVAAMPGLLNAAAASGTDLATTADIVSDTLTAMGLAAKDTNALADVMTKTTVTANTNLVQMGEALKYVSATAHSVGATKEELSGMIGMLGDIGLKGSIAGTSLNRMLQHIAKAPFEKGKRNALQALGIDPDSLMDAKGNLRPISGIITDIAKAVKSSGKGTAETINLLTNIFGQQGQRAFAAFMADTGKNLEDYVSQLEGAMGTAEQVAKAKLDNMKGDITILGSAFETTMIKLGAAITPFVRPIIKVFTKLIALVGIFVNTPLGKVVVGLVAAFAAFLIVLGGVNVAMGLTKLLSGSLAKSMLNLGLSEVATTFATGGLTAGFGALATAIWAALAPILPFIAAAAALVAIGYGVYKAIETSNEAFAAFNDEIERIQQSDLSSALQADAIDELYSKMSPVNKLFTAFGAVIEAVGQIWDSFNSDTGEFALTESVATALEKLGLLDFVLAIGTWIGRVKTFFAGVSEGFFQVVTAIQEVVMYLHSKLVAGMNKAASILNKFGISIGKGVGKLNQWKEVGIVIGKVIGAILIPIFLALGAVALVTATGMILAFLPIIIVFGTIALAVWAIYKAVEYLIIGFKIVGAWIGQLWVALSDFFGQVGEWFTGLWTSAVEVGSKIVNGIIDGLNEAWGSLVEWLTNHIIDLPFGDALLSFLGEGTGNTAAVPATTTNRPSSDNMRTGDLRTAPVTAGPIVVQNTTDRLVDNSTSVYLDGEVIYKNISKRSNDENNRY